MVRARRVDGYKRTDLVQFTGAPELKRTVKGVNMGSVVSIFDGFIN